jgi:hypothetical protein
LSVIFSWIKNPNPQAKHRKMDEFDIATEDLPKKQTPVKGGLKKTDVYEAIEKQTAMLQNQSVLLEKILLALQNLNISGRADSSTTYDLADFLSQRQKMSSDVPMFPVGKFGAVVQTVHDVKQEGRPTNYETPMKEGGSVVKFKSSSQKKSPHWSSGIKISTQLTPSKEMFLKMPEEQKYEWCFANGQPNNGEIVGILPMYKGKPRIIYEGRNGALYFVRMNQEGIQYRNAFSPAEQDVIRQASN